MADTHVETSSDVNQDSLDGAQPSTGHSTPLGSAEEYSEKENTNDTPSENTGDVPEVNGHESAEVEDAKENGDSAQDTNGVEADHHVNGKNGEAEADSTEVDGVVAEKRKSIVEAETVSLSPKKARIEGATEEAAAETAVEAPTNGDSVEAAA